MIRRGRVDDGTDFGNSIRGKAAFLRVHTNHLFVGRDVDAINLVIRHVTFDPLNLRPDCATPSKIFVRWRGAVPATFSLRQEFLFRSHT